MFESPLASLQRYGWYSEFFSSEPSEHEKKRIAQNKLADVIQRHKTGTENMSRETKFFASRDKKWHIFDPVQMSGKICFADVFVFAWKMISFSFRT